MSDDQHPSEVWPILFTPDRLAEYLKMVEEVRDRFAEYSAEIEQLKVVVESQNRSIDRHLGLISELCDALEWYVPLSLTLRDRELLQRAREASKQ